MAIWNKTTQAYINDNKTLFEVSQLATKDGIPVSDANPFPVTLGSANITITGNVNVGTEIRVNNTEQQSIPVHLTDDPIAVTGTFWQATQPVSGSVSVSNLPATQPVSGSVSVSNFPATQPVSGTFWQATQPVSGSVSVSNFPTSQITSFSGGSTDAFGRLRVSEQFTLGDYKHTYGIDPNFRDTLFNGGTVTHASNQAAARLTTTSNTSSRAIHQTKMYHNYMPGKSQLIKSTINFYAATSNVTKRTGYYDDLNGIYFEQNGEGVLSFVVRTNTSGTASDARRIVQADWNKDKCDGTGASGFNLDITKTQIVIIDFQWLGVGRIRCGFVHNGELIIAHEFYNSNVLPVVYMSNPNLPIRCEILNTGATTGAYLDQICGTVVSEGGYTESGVDWFINSGVTAQAITLANNIYPILAIRLKNTFQSYPNRAIVRAEDISIYATDNPVYWTLIKLDGIANLTLSNATWTSVDNDSAVEYNLTGTAFTGGDAMIGGIAGTTSPGGSAKGTGASGINNPATSKKNFIAQNFDSSDSEIYLICGQAIAGTTNVWATMQWREIK
jgi:hypothetical protein